MSKWRVERAGPDWLMDTDGRLAGYRDKKGVDRLILQAASPPQEHSIAPSGILLADGGPTFGGPRVLTGTSVETAMYQYTLPGWTLGYSRRLIIDVDVSHTNSANNKTVKIKFGSGTNAIQLTSTTSAVEGTRLRAVIKNAGSFGVQRVMQQLGFGTVGSADVTSSIDTRLDQPVTVTLALATFTELISLNDVSVMVA